MFMRFLRHLFFFLLYGALGLLVGLSTFYVLQMNARPDLEVWHQARLPEEFRARDSDRVPDLAAYLALEQRLFAQLDERVYAEVEPEQASLLNRYWSGSRVDARAMQPDWNRTQILTAAEPRGAALLVHGLSDSPYSLRAMAEHLHAQGWTVVVLRLPGHGTAPLGLLDVRWQDWSAALRLAARDMVQRVGPDKPFVLVGYSMGAALSVEYVLAERQGETLPRPSAVVLLSPAIGVSPSARFASLQKEFARVPGLAKLAWLDLFPEYDSYKYGSFAVNAGEQMWRLTRRIDSQLQALAEPGGVQGLPPMLGFQSVADATVSSQAVVTALYQRLSPTGGHALVLFDANRLTSTRPLLRPGLFTLRDALLQGPALPFELTVITNAAEDKAAVAAWRRAAQSDGVQQQPLALAWPPGLFSLSHVALPIAPDDPLYGARPPDSHAAGIYLGRPSLFGERGLLAVPEAALMRLRHNPFFPYVVTRVDDFLADTGRRAVPAAAQPADLHPPLQTVR